jgi:aryl-alcohol dehydrogenase-like predicted oxidoreductase
MQLALGTVQFGLAYGIAGRGEAVPEKEVRAILEDAVARGTRTLDTAAGYGDIEMRLARLCADLPVKFISKFPAIPDELTPDQASTFALDSARRSRERLGGALRGLMAHRAQDLLGERGNAVWPALERWARSEGITLGASCYTPEEAADLLRLRAIGMAQLPGNALDQRIARAGGPGTLQGCEIHLRSVFLQGLLLMPLQRATERLPSAADALRHWHAWTARQGLKPIEAAVGIAKSFARVSAVVVGTDSLEQWRSIADAWDSTSAISAPELATDQASVIDPRLWKVGL